MPVSSQEIRSRLLKYERPEDADQNLHRPKILHILKVIGRRGPLSVRSLIEEKEIKDNHIGVNFIVAAISWLVKIGRVSEEWEGRKRLLRLTKQGEDAVLLLDELLMKEPKLPVELAFPVGEGEVNAKVEVETMGPNLSPIQLLRVPTNFRVLDRLKEITLLIPHDNPDLADPGDLKLTLTINSRNINWKILHFQFQLWYFWKTVIEIGKDGEPPDSLLALGNPSDPIALTFDPYLTETKYCGYWQSLLKKLQTTQEMGKQVQIEDFIPRFVVEGCNDQEIRKWIAKQLHSNPDFFMPNTLWTKLGFKPKERDIMQLMQLSPLPEPAIKPEYIDWGLISWLNSAHRYRRGDIKPSDLYAYPVLGAMDEMARRRGLSNLRALYSSFASYLTGKQKKDKLYETWKLVRADFRDKLPDISQILDASLIKFIVKGFPDDLKAVFEDLANEKYTVDRAVQLIKEGSYELKDRRL